MANFWLPSNKFQQGIKNIVKSSFGCKYLLNCIRQIMKCYNYHHTNVRPGLIQNLEKAINTITDITQHLRLNSTINVKNVDDETYNNAKFQFPECSNWPVFTAMTVLTSKIEIKIKFLFPFRNTILTKFYR